MPPVYFGENRVDERGFKEEKGIIYCWSEDKLLSPSILVEADESIVAKLQDYRIINDELVFDEQLSKRNQATTLKSMREPLLKALDTYNVNVTRGIISESDEQKERILTWYQNILDLNEEAIHNPPREIAYYMS